MCTKHISMYVFIQMDEHIQFNSTYLHPQFGRAYRHTHTHAMLTSVCLLQMCHPTFKVMVHAICNHLSWMIHSSLKMNDFVMSSNSLFSPPPCLFWIQLEALSSNLAFLHRNDMKLLVVHGASLPDSTNMSDQELQVTVETVKITINFQHQDEIFTF